MTQRPDVSDEDIGMRAFQLRKAKAVERAAERMRHTLGADWGQMTHHEIEEFEWILGELWAYVARTDWDELRFGRVTLDEARRIIHLSRELRRHTRGAVEILNDVYAIVKAHG